VAGLGDNRAMLDILFVTFPFFTLVLAGFVATYRGWLPISAVPGLNGFVLYFAVPCMLFRFGANTPVSQLLNPLVFGVYLLCALLMVAITIALTKRGSIGWNDASLGALVAVFPNTGFMGVPLLTTLLGEASAGPVIATLSVDIVITSSLCVGLSRLDGAGSHGVWPATQQALIRAASNPMPWSIVLGALASHYDFALWDPVDQTVAMLANAASPVALFTIGAVLARSQINNAHRMPTSHYLPGTLLKLVVHPLMLWGIGMLARLAGLPLEPFTLTCIVLVACLPSASNVSLLAERFSADTGRIARIILVTTAVAFFSFSAAVALLT
jgi:malonate transporter